MSEPAKATAASPRGPVARARVYFFFFAFFALLVFLTHLPFVNLPLYWDELGQFVPASLDLYRRGLWVPRSTVPNVHPPGLMTYLAGVWHVFGYSLASTRLAMLLVASACAFVAFLLAIRLSREVKGAPAFSAVLLLLVSPLFYTQAMLAQLDLPAALLTVWALLWFLEDRHREAALVSVALVLVKETGLVVPLVFGGWLLMEGRRKRAAWFLLPGVALAGWLLVLWRTTGHPLGNTEFEEYNFFFPLHPVRALVALLRRAYYLFAANFHWIGWVAVALAWRRTRIYANRAWRIAGALALAHVLLVSLLGGATLERYLLPVLPLMYAAFAVAWSSLRSFRAGPARIALFAGMALCLFVNPPYPYPFENNLAMVDFVRLQESAARFLEDNYAQRAITTAWPLSAALRRPAYGYVARPLTVKAVPSFRRSDVAAVDAAGVDIIVLYSREWERSWDPRRARGLRELMRRYYGYEPQVTSEELERMLKVRMVVHWERRGQWLAIFERQPT